MYMEINKVDSLNTYKYTSNQAFKNFKQSYSKINSDNYLPEKDNNLKVKTGVLSAAIASTMAVLYLITKNRGKNPLKNFNIFKQEITPMNMLQITGVSVPASFLAGIALDKKENAKPKLKEGISQMVGNLIIPITLVNESIKLKDRIDKKVFDNFLLKGLQKAHKAIYTTVALLGGLFIGNKVANYANSAIFKDKNQRPLKIKDFFVHADDVCFATSLIFKDNKIRKIAGRFIPATLLISAYETGTKNINSKD